MRRHPSTIVHVVAVCMALSGALAPAHAGGLISTERAAAQGAQAAGGATQTAEVAHAQRTRLQAALIAGGVESGHAAQRLAALSDAEIAELTSQIDSGPAGGLWFMPFVVVAAVIGVLISPREAAASTGPTRTDLFGRPRIAAMP